MLNYALLKNPLNWAIIILMVMLGGFIVDIFATYTRTAQAPASNGLAAN